MTRKNYILTAISLLFVAAYSYAGNRTVEEAQKAAMELLQRNAPRRAKGQTISASAKPRLVATKQRQGEGAYYYVFSNGEGKGYTMVSGDDRLPEIMCYTESGNYDDMPKALTDILQGYRNMVDSATDEQIAEIRAQRANAKQHENVAPLLTTSWGQSWPYNNRCPSVKYIDSYTNAVAGCGPTAVAQILKYYNWPKELKKEIPAYTTPTLENIEMPAIPAGEKLDWANMLDDYYDVNTPIGTEEQQAAVAKLFLYVGCAMNAGYAATGTGTRPRGFHFVEFFGMDPELTRNYYHSGYSTYEWDNLLYSEISDKRPVYYEGTAHEPHAFIIHGYKDGMYCVNWGWNLNVSYCDLILLDGWNTANSMIFTQPDNGVVDDDLYSVVLVAGFSAGNIQNTKVENGVLTATVHGYGQSCAVRPTSRYLSVGYKDMDGHIVNVGEPQYVVVSPVVRNNVIVGTGATIPISLAYEEGRTYDLMLIESDDARRWVQCEQYDSWCTSAVTVRDGKVTVDDGATLTATAALDTASCGYAGFDNTLNVTVENHGPRNYYSQLHIYVSRDSEQPATPTFRQSVSVTPGGTFTLPVSLVGSWYEEPGEYNVWIWACVKPGTGYNGTEYIGHGTFTLTKSPPADLRLRGVRVVNATGEKVFAEFRNGKHEDSPHLYEMDKVEGTEAVFEFDIENVGGYYHKDYVVMNEYKVAKTGYADSDGNSIIAPCFTDVLTPECYDFTMLAGERRTFTVSTTAHVNGVAGMQVWNGVKDLETPIEHRRKDSPYPYTFRRADICYLAGAASGVRDASLPDVPDLVAVGGKGSVTIGANASARVSVVSSSGALVRRLSLRAGEKATLALAPGVYAVNGKKVVVR